MNRKIERLLRVNLEFLHLNKQVETELGLSLIQYHLLEKIRHRPACSPQRLAEAAGIHPASLTQSLKRLQKKGLIFVHMDPRDSRKKVIGLRPQGSAFLKRFESGIGNFI